jgi:hypothetical protein
MHKLTTFLQAWAQVMLVVLNTWQIANGKIVGAIIVGFLISLVWTFNVKRAAFATWTTRIIYCAGASAGTGTGLLLADLLY